MLKAKFLVRKGHNGDMWFVIERKEYFKNSGSLGTVIEKIVAPFYNKQSAAVALTYKKRIANEQ